MAIAPIPISAPAHHDTPRPPPGTPQRGRRVGEMGKADLAHVAAQENDRKTHERPAETIRVSDVVLRRVGQMFGTADIIAQMADRRYLEKCRDRPCPEFILGDRAGEKLNGARTLPHLASGDDLVRKTPGFYQNASEHLDLQLARAYEYALRHFGGQNLYLQAMLKNIQYAQFVGEATAKKLRRQPPRTLNPGVEPYPKDLLGPDAA